MPEAEKKALYAAAVARSLKGQLAFEPDARPEFEATVARLDIDFAKHVRPSADMFWSRITKDRILAIARATLGPVWASARAKYKKADLARAMEEAFAADPPEEPDPERARAAALAWTPPGFAPFDTGRVEEAVEEDPSAEEPGPGSRQWQDASIPTGGDDAPSDAESGPAGDDTAGGDAPARGELARAIDAMNAVPTADGSPRVIVQGFDSADGLVNGESGDVPEFLRGD